MHVLLILPSRTIRFAFVFMLAARLEELLRVTSNVRSVIAMR
jgi:hypothetical protein